MAKTNDPAAESVRRPPIVAVVGPAEADDALLAVAEEIGRELAEQGAVVVTGGLGGVMAAACRGAVSAGGATLGLLPGADRSEANPWVTLAIPTGLGQARNALVALAADVVVSVGGSWGTLSEIAHARRAGRPVVGIAGWHVADASGSPLPGVVTADEPEAAVAAALSLLGDGNHS